MPSETTIETLRGLLRRIGLELAFAEPGRGCETGPLGALVGELHAAASASGPPREIAEGLAAAVTRLADPTTTDLATWLGIWHDWMEEALTAWAQARPLSPWLAPPSAPAADVMAAAIDSPPVAPPRPAARDRWQPPADPAEMEVVAVLPAGAEPELMRLFCAEAEELLGDIERSAITLESTPDDADTLATMFRGFHTLKGNAAVMRLVVLQRLAHEVESLLDAARRGSRRLDRDAIDVVLAAADTVGRAVAEMSRQLDGHEPGRAIPLPVKAIVERVHVVLASPPAGPASGGAEPGPAAPASAPAAAPAMVPSADVAPTVPVAAPPVPAPGSAPAPTPPARAAAAAASVRVDTAKLDGLVDLVGELVIAQSMVVQAADGRSHEQLTRALHRLRGITADLQRTAMAMRMVPIRGTFQKMGRLVRDVAVGLGKEIRLIVEGEETELDRTVIEELGDPLVHMIRNAADHGIESPAERLAAGKPPAGTISLRAFHQGGHVVIQIADDGRGLDPARIRRTAVERGLIAADTALDPRDTLELIFAPGFSTAATVTDLSGRGVGMDVVRRNLERVRGKIEIDSVPGGGTTFTIFMPLTLAIIEGLIVAVAGQRFVIPALAVRESLRPLPGSVTTIQGRGELVDVRGRQLPLVRLGRHLGIGGEEDPARGIVVVLEAGHDRRGLFVDELLGRQEVVIKSLGEIFTGRTDFAGAAILGDGRVGLILDTTALVRLGKRPAEAAA